MSDEITLGQVTAMNLDEENGAKIYLPVVPPVPGDSALESVSNNVASVITLYTDKTGRSFRGRSYIPGMSEQYVSQNEVTAPVAAGIISDFVALDVDLSNIDCQLVVASYQSNNLPRMEGVATPITSYAVNLRVDTQRRRLPK